MYKRRSEKQLVLYERKLMLVAFQIRTLLDRYKVNDRVRRLMLHVLRYPKISDKPFTLLGSGWPEDHFDLTAPKTEELPVRDVCNQLIHYYWMTTASEGRRFTRVFIFSDFNRRTCAYEFDVKGLIDLFSAFSDEESVVDRCGYVWNEKKRDYVINYAHEANIG